PKELFRSTPTEDLLLFLCFAFMFIVHSARPESTTSVRIAFIGAALLATLWGSANSGRDARGIFNSSLLLRIQTARRNQADRRCAFWCLAFNRTDGPGMARRE